MKLVGCATAVITGTQTLLPHRRSHEEKQLVQLVARDCEALYRYAQRQVIRPLR